MRTEQIIDIYKAFIASWMEGTEDNVPRFVDGIAKTRIIIKSG